MTMIAGKTVRASGESIDVDIGAEWDMVSFWFATDTLVETLTASGIELYKYQPGSGYAGVTQSTEIERGKSYFAKSVFGGSFNFQAQSFNNETFELSLDQGWNMIGNPYAESITMEDVAVEGASLSTPGEALANTPAFYYGAGRYSEAEGSLKKGEGFWVYASYPVSIDFTSPSPVEVVAEAGEDARCLIGVYYDGERIDDVMVYNEYDVECVLDGSGSYGSGDLTYEWTQDSGTAVEISGATSSQATFIPQGESIYTFRLTVSNGETSNSDVVVVDAKRVTGKIVFWSALEQDYTGYNIYTMNADGSGMNSFVFEEGDASWPRWSPDGERIVFESNRGGELYNIYVMDASGENIVQLTDNGFHNYEPDWSVNGKVAFTSKMDGMGDLYDMDPDVGVSSLRQLTDMRKNNMRPRYSFDGEWIVTRVDYGGDNWEVAVMDKDGNSFTQITDGTSIKTYSTWTTDGRILFNELDDWLPPYRIKVIDRDGTNEAEWPKFDSTHQITMPDMTDDGKYIFYISESDEGYIHAMCSDGSCDSRIGYQARSLDYHPGTCAECSQ